MKTPSSSRRKDVITLTSFKVLLLSECKDTCSLVSKQLEIGAEDKIEFAWCSSSSLALSREASKFDLILVSDRVPDIQNPEVFQKLQKKFSRAAFVVIADDEDGDVACFAQQLGADEYLEKKDVANRLFAALVLGICERKRLRQNESNQEDELFVNGSTLFDALVSIVDTTCEVTRTDVKGNITYANDNFCSYSGYSREELIGQNHRILKSGVHPDSVYKEMWKTISRGDIWRGEVCNRTKQGDLSWMDSPVGPIRDASGKRKGYIAVRYDINKRKKTDIALKQSRAFLDKVLDGLPVAVFVKDAEHLRFVHWNRAGEQLTGIPSAEMLGKSDFDFFPKEDAEKYVARDRSVLEGNTHLEYEEDIQTRFNGIRQVLTVKVPLKDETGQAQFLLGIAQDITDRKQAEAEMEALNTRYIDASHKAGMAEVATNVLHNVGNVLNSVNVSTSVVEERLGNRKIDGFCKIVEILVHQIDDLPSFFQNDPRGPQIPDYLSKFSQYLIKENAILIEEAKSVRKNIEHINSIVSMQQSFAKNSGIIEVLDPRTVLEDAISINKVALNRHDIEVLCEFRETPLVEMERNKVLQILTNLIRNAIDAFKESQVPNRCIILESDTSDDYVVFSVKDNGIGITEENLTLIFNHGFTTRKEGHGFGLHSAANSATEMGGSLSVCSEGVGKGARFSLKLPMKHQGKAPSAKIENFTSSSADSQIPACDPEQPHLAKV